MAMANDTVEHVGNEWMNSWDAGKQEEHTFPQDRLETVYLHQQTGQINNESWRRERRRKD